MFTKRSFATHMITAITLATALTGQAFAANECDYYKEGVEHYENLRRMGGTLEEMNFWTAKGHEFEDKLYHCRQDTEINPGIQITSGEAPAETQTVKREHKPLRSSISDDAQLQQLIKTCNYWIAQSNENASQDNLNFRDTACRAVDNHQNREDNHQNAEDNHQNTQENPSAPSATVAVRKLKDCIKPNNRIDNEVNECVKGNIEPTWKK